MDFICVLQLKPQYRTHSNWTEQTNAVLNDHWNYLVKLHTEGKIKFVSRTDYDISNDANRGYAVYAAENETEARTMAANDPCIKNNVMDFELHPLKVFMLGSEITAG